MVAVGVGYDGGSLITVEALAVQLLNNVTVQLIDEPYWNVNCRIDVRLKASREILRNPFPRSYDQRFLPII
jgi:hypothetical protein